MMDPNQALIICGGRGTRLKPLTNRMPKPLLPVKGTPFLEFLMDYLKIQGFSNFILATGYKSKMIENYFGRGEDLGVNIDYSKERVPLGTGGAVKKAESLITGKEIVVLNGDSFADLDLKKMIRLHNKMKQPITMAVARTKDSGRSGQLGINKGIVTRFEEKGKQKEGFVNAGVYVFRKELLGSIPKKKVSLEKEIFPKFLGKIATFETNGYFIDIGVKKDYRRFKKEAGRIMPEKKRLAKKKAVFIDRDGVINKEKGYVHKLEDFDFEKSALKGLRSIDFGNYSLFLVSNQSGIAKGYYTEEDFELFDFEIRNILRKRGVKVTKSYYCPHHSEGKVKEFKKDCVCRKPNPGLLLKAEKEFGVSLKDSYLIGDKTSDILAGKRAGCRTILVKTGYKGKDNLYSVKPDFTVRNLSEAVEIVNTA